MSIVQDVTFTHQKLELIALAAAQQQLAESESPPALLESAPPVKPALRDVAEIPMEVQNVLQLAQELLIISTGAAGVAIALGDSGSMQCVSSIGDAPSLNIPLQLGSTLSGQCVRTGQVVRFHSANTPEVYAGPRSALLAPVFLHGCVAGLIGIFSGEADAFENGSLAAIRHAAIMIGLCLANMEQVPKLASSYEIGWGKPSPQAPYLVASTATQACNAATVRQEPIRQADRHLLGLPCPVCGTYSLSHESICGVCQTAMQ